MGKRFALLKEAEAKTTECDTEVEITRCQAWNHWERTRLSSAAGRPRSRWKEDYGAGAWEIALAR
ncbi:hypothetical protein K0M31_014254 [Melipona bicolor]|uniref:Uncharacterized protein n=1 Tax=Melipona bicolor TaxID=60889 RepID=A0AA40KU46_9HYME|nr:hypothetical protein K0M31_014254 [Melipona bicolor]